MATAGRPAWFPDWSDRPCAVVASGTSVTAEEVEKLRGRAFVLVVNNGHALAPWADALYAADGRWWDLYPTARDFAGLKVTADAGAAARYGLHRVALVGETEPGVHCIRLGRPGLIGRGGNGGFQALNLALQFGTRRILLLGFDFTGDHWHEKHPEPLKNPRPQTLAKWRDRLDAQAPGLAALGAEVVNCSPVSALAAFGRATIDATLDRWGR